MNQYLEFLKRHSTPARGLSEPAPSAAQLEQIFQIAASAPDHGRMQPYRFISIRGEARQALSRVFGDALRLRNPKVDAAYLKKVQEKPLHAPLLVVVVASLTASDKVPQIEQMLSAGSTALNILLACKALGFGAIWLTGDSAYDAHVCRALGLAGNEKIIAFIHIGTESVQLSSPQPTLAATKISHWRGPTDIDKHPPGYR